MTTLMNLISRLVILVMSGCMLALCVSVLRSLAEVYQDKSPFYLGVALVMAIALGAVGVLFAWLGFGPDEEEDPLAS